MVSSLKNLLIKSGIISITGSPVPYGISYLVLSHFKELTFFDTILLLTVLYTIINTGRIFILEYIFDRKGINFDDNITTLIRRLLRK